MRPVRRRPRVLMARASPCSSASARGVSRSSAMRARRRPSNAGVGLRPDRPRRPLPPPAGVAPRVAQRLAEARRRSADACSSVVVACSPPGCGSAPARRTRAASRAPRVERVGEPLDVAERLRHLLAGEPQHAVVHPRAREALAGAPPTARARSRGAGRSGRGRRRARRSPRRGASRAIAEHSMCQPGRPRPQGESQARVLVGLVGLPEREVERRALALARLDAASRRSARPAAGPRARRTADRPRR